MGDKTINIASHTGRTRDGAPLAWSRAPAADLRPWLSGWNVAAGEVPNGQPIRCGRLNDLSCLTLLYEDPWKAATADGELVFEPGDNGIALYFGPQTHFMMLEMEGKFAAITLYFTAGAPPALGFPKQSEMLNRIVSFDTLTNRDQPFAAGVAREADFEDWIRAAERELRSVIHGLEADAPDELAAAFERRLLADPGFAIEEFAESEGVNLRTLERCIKRNFGITPKQAVRRARALDLASKLLGVALPEEEQVMELRFFDQSHQIREMKHFFNMTPRELSTGPHPLLRVNLEARQRRRLDALERLSLDVVPEWRDPRTEPSPGNGKT